MFEIVLENCGKKFNRNWIFKDFNHSFTSGNAYAVLGPNGSGKSTLLQCIAGYMAISKGKINFSQDSRLIEEDEKYRHLVIASPFLELIEEFTLQETVDFHFKMKKQAFIKHPEEIIEITGLGSSANKQLKFFSSGMKQRVKIALAVFSDVPVLMLDEPCTNFDAKGIDWYLNLVEQYTSQRLVLVASNQPHEYSFCKEMITVAQN
ncbi:ATP-binding cassette domain-containing protein [Oscillatoria amoena NRMC-F 0135]|nr:ATP-binding cassette domain-containing protein [Oscillatoria amoena NRMC-F 0135]